MNKKVWILIGAVVLTGAVWVMRLNKEQVPEEVVHQEIQLETETPAKPISEIAPEETTVQEPTGTNEMVSGHVQTLIDPASSYRVRLNAMRELGYELSDQDVTALMAFLKQPIPADASLTPLSYNSIRNDAFEILMRQKQMPDGLGELLTDAFNDLAGDPMWRNYCLQFMEPYYEKQATIPNDQSPALSNEEPSPRLGAIQDALWTALDERDNSNAGTALLAMDKLSRSHAEFDKEQIDAVMVDLAGDEQASIGNRVTALRLCGERGNIQALETARNLARQCDVTMIRCAAIATLGDIGTEEDLDFITECTRSQDKRISQIAKLSLKKLTPHP